MFVENCYLELTIANRSEDNADGPEHEPPEVWAPWSLVVSVSNPNAPPPVSVKTSPGPAWDIAKVQRPKHEADT